MWRRAAWSVLLVSGCAEVLGFGDPVQIASDAAAPTPEADAAAPPTDAGEPNANERFCDRTPAPTFCTSFDVPDWASEWSRTGIDLGSMDRTTDDPFSPPASLRVRAEVPNAKASANVDFPAFAELPSEAEVTFHLRVDAANDDDLVAVLSELFTVARPDGSPLVILQLMARQRTTGQLSLSILEVDLVGGKSVDHPLAREMPIGRWTEIRFALKPASGAVAAHVDGVIAYSGSLSVTLPRGMPRFTLGVVHADSASPAWDVRFDDVLIDYR